MISAAETNILRKSPRERGQLLYCWNRKEFYWQLEKTNKEQGVEVLTDKRPGHGGPPEEIIRVRLPNKRNREIFACAELMMGANHIRVRCFDGVTRMGRIKGKIKKKVWIREGDILIVVPWSFQDDKCDIIYRYTGPQVEWLRKNGYL